MRDASGRASREMEELTVLEHRTEPPAELENHGRPGLADGLGATVVRARGRRHRRGGDGRGPDAAAAPTASGLQGSVRGSRGETGASPPGGDVRPARAVRGTTDVGGA